MLAPASIVVGTNRCANRRQRPVALDGAAEPCVAFLHAQYSPNSCALVFVDETALVDDVGAFSVAAKPCLAFVILAQYSSNSWAFVFDDNGALEDVGALCAADPEVVPGLVRDVRLLLVEMGGPPLLTV